MIFKNVSLLDQLCGLKQVIVNWLKIKKEKPYIYKRIQA